MLSQRTMARTKHQSRRTTRDFTVRSVRRHTICQMEQLHGDARDAQHSIPSLRAKCHAAPSCRWNVRVAQSGVRLCLASIPTDTMKRMRLPCAIGGKPLPRSLWSIDGPKHRGSVP